MIRYRVWTDDEDGAMEIPATDPECAAVLYVELYDQGDGDYPVASVGEKIRVSAQDPEGQVLHFDVHGFWDPTYVAYQVEESGEPQAV